MSSTSNDHQDFIHKHNLAPLLGGLAGGCVSTILLYPLDLIKVRMQVNEEPFHFFGNSKTSNERTKSGISRNNFNTSSSYKPIPTPAQQQPQIQTQIKIQRSILSQFRGVVRKEGLLGLYQGLSPALVASTISWGGYFYFYESIKHELLRKKRTRIEMRESKLKSKSKIGLDKNDNMEESSSSIKLVPLENFAAACSAGAMLVFITNPIWLVKTRMQLQARQLNSLTANSMSHESKNNNNLRPKKLKITPYNGILDAMRTIVREEGPMGLYKGFIPALMLVSHGGVQFVCYEFLKGKFGKHERSQRGRSRTVLNVHDNKKNKSSASPPSTIFQQLKESAGYLTMGAVSKIIASSITYPLQVIKSRIQQRANHISQLQTLTEPSSSKGQTKSTKMLTVIPYNGVIDCTKRIWLHEGIYGFFKGCVPNAIRVAPSAAVTFVVYEGVMDILTMV